jgi:hypothetical protein
VNDLAGVGYACKIDGNLDGELYEQILEDELLQSLDYYGLQVDQFIFQQDNDPKHICKRAKEWFQRKNIEVLIWPAQSPDLNPIEHLWEFVKKKLNEYPEPLKGILELWERMQVEWEKIPRETCQKPIGSMLDRVRAVYKAKGDYTEY